MAITNTSERAAGRNLQPSTRLGGWFAGGGLLSAGLAAACCVLPLALFSLGVGGAWLGTLRTFEPYQPLFAALALGLIGAGFWSLRRRRRACMAAGYCATTMATRITTLALWTATALVLLALAWPYLLPLLLG